MNNDSSIKGNYEAEILNGGIENTEARINMQRTMHAVSGGNDSAIRGNRESEDLDFAAKERAHRMNGYNNNPIEQHYGSAENMTTDNLDQLAASNNAVNLEQNSRAGRYDSGIGGSYDDMSSAEHDQLAASNNAVNREQNSRAGRYDGAVGGTIEDAIASGDGLNHLEAARASQIAESRPHINSLQALLTNPHGFDPDGFKIIVSNGLKNNQILKNFMENFRERLAEQVELIANTPTTPEELITRNNLMENKFFQNSEELANLSTESIRSKAKSTVEAYLNIYAHLRHEIKAQNGVIDQNYITISEDMIGRIFDAQKVLGREKLSQLIMMPTPLKTHSQYNVGDFISPAVAALYSLDPEMRKNGVGLNVNTDVYKNPKSPRWQERSMEEGM